MALSATGCCGIDSIKRVQKGHEPSNGELPADSYLTGWTGCETCFWQSLSCRIAINHDHTGKKSSCMPPIVFPKHLPRPAPDLWWNCSYHIK